jgi:YVTN family beta-propeller protein
MAWDQKRGLLYIEATNQDAVAIVDTNARRVLANLELQPFPVKVSGIAPTALTLSPDGSTLYVACGGINAVAVVDARTRTVNGMIPTAWYPDAIDISPDGATF